MLPHNQLFIALNRWEELSKGSPHNIQNPNGLLFENKLEEESSNKKIVILTKRLTLFEQIDAFFQLLTQKLFNRDPHMQAILPKTWKALIAEIPVQSYTCEKASWSSLPNEISDLITTYLNLSDLAALSQTNTKFKKLDTGWKSVANRIECSLNPQPSSKQQIQVFISKIKQKSEALLNFPYLGSLIKSNDVDNLCNLQKLIKARETQIIWKVLALSTSQPGEAPSIKTFNRIEELLKIPKQFTTWCSLHQNAFIHLQKLNLSDNQLSFLPSEIGNLTHLKRLDLCNNQLTSLPPEIGKLTQLTCLTLDNNQLTLLPPEIGNLTQLTDLRLSYNQLTSLPTTIGNLPQLTWLNLNKNQLTSLPTEVGNLTQLTWLTLYKNQFTSLPTEISNLTHLKALYLDKNQLTSLPTEIGNLTQLAWLALSNNSLTSLPTEIANLVHLQKLNLSNNQLTSLPTEIGNLAQLTRLALSNNSLTSLPTEIGNLTRLAKLTLHNNPLNLSLGFSRQQLVG